MNDEDIEREINRKGLNAPRIRPEDIDRVIISSTFSILPSGKTMICELLLKNGFTVRGEASVVSLENFDKDIGERISFSNARNKIWELEAYLLQEKLYNDRRG